MSRGREAVALRAAASSTDHHTAAEHPRGRTARRGLRAGLPGLFIATAIGSIGLPAGGTAGPLIAAELAGSRAAAGLPLGVLVVGTAVAALLISRWTVRIGRGPALMLGYGTGALGAVLSVLSVEMGSIVGLLVGTFILGSANAAIFLTRYAAAEIGAARGRALGTILFATAVGAVAGPSLLGPSASLADAVGVPPLTGLYIVAFVSFVVAALVLTVVSDARVPLLGLAAPLFKAKVDGLTIERGEVWAALRADAPRKALVILALTNLVMVAVMAIAPIEMRAHGHDLRLVGAAISMHVAGMFGPSLISGWLADRVGARPVAAAGFVLLIATGVGGGVLDLGDAASTIAFLFTLGLGWNLGVVGGSTLLVRSVPEPLRPHAEGIGEVAMSVAAAGGAPAAGIVASTGGFASVSLAGALVATIGSILVHATRPIRPVLLAEPDGGPGTEAGVAREARRS